MSLYLPLLIPSIVLLFAALRAQEWMEDLQWPH
jgi:hypothetical protein